MFKQLGKAQGAAAAQAHYLLIGRGSYPVIQFLLDPTSTCEAGAYLALQGKGLTLQQDTPITETEALAEMRNQFLYQSFLSGSNSASCVLTHSHYLLSYLPHKFVALISVQKQHTNCLTLSLDLIKSVYSSFITVQPITPKQHRHLLSHPDSVGQ